MGFFNNNKELTEQLRLTQAKLSARDAELAAINRNLAVIEFTPSGQILSANESFLEIMGYNSAQVVGKHHSMFCKKSVSQSSAYRICGTNWLLVRP
jgi:methyl-accepting chemotaxis protein